MKIASACAVLAALAAAGCSAGQSSSAARLAPGAVASPAGSQRTAAGSQGPAGPGSSSRASAPSSGGTQPVLASPGVSGTPSPVASNITVAPAGTMRQGPMKITPVYCGKLSAAQRARFGTTAAGGLIYKYANISASVTGSAKLYAAFTASGGIAGSNYAGTVPSVAPGKSGEGEVDAVGVQGQDLSFTGCEIMSYALVTPTGVDPVSYAG